MIARVMAGLCLLAIGAALLVVLGGCASGPTPFEEGAEMLPPAGCLEGRARGVDC